MAALKLISFLLIFFTTTTTARGFNSHIKASCRYTRFPSLCVRSLTSYSQIANVTIETPRDTAKYTLLYSLYRTQSTRSYLLRVTKDSSAVKDCLAQIDLSVSELYMSIRELHEFTHKPPRYGGTVSWHISNVESWVGSALTCLSDCLDELRGQRLSKFKATVKGKVMNVAEVTSNALVLFHRFASGYYYHQPKEP